MKNIGIGLVAISLFWLVNTVQASIPPLSLPKVSSHKSLDRQGKKSKKRAVLLVQTSQTEQGVSKADQEIMIDLLLAAGCRMSGCARPLLPEYQGAIESMASMPQPEKWRLIGVLKKFDQIVLQKESNEESDEKLAKIRTEMHSLDAGDCHHHAHAPKAKHKRGDSF